MPLFNIAGKHANLFGKGFQGMRDFVLDRFTPRPEALFIKAMTGGAPTQTDMTPTELGKIKDAFQTQKQFTLFSDEELLDNMKAKYATFKNKNPLMNGINAPTLEQAQQINAQAKAQQSDPVTNLYNYGRDMKMSYGNLSVYPQPDGGVRIYDRWKVDKNLNQAKDEKDRVGDLIEGGPIPSLIYNAANKVGTYKPFDIDVTVPGEEWKKIQPISTGRSAPKNFNSLKEATKYYETLMQQDQAEDQGSFLNTVNNIYRKFNPLPTAKPQEKAADFASFMSKAQEK